MIKSINDNFNGILFELFKAEFVLGNILLSNLTLKPSSVIKSKSSPFVI